MPMQFKIEKASPSTYVTFRKCPMLFWIDYIHPDKDKFKFANNSVGHAVEHTIHHFLKDNDVSDRTLERLLAEFETVWYSLRDDEDWAIKKGQEEEEKKERAQTTLIKFFETAGEEFLSKTPIFYSPTLRDSKRDPRAKYFTITHPVQDGLTISGRPDRIDKIDGGFEVIDYKYKPVDDTGRYERDNIQLRMYGILVNDWLKENNYDGEVTRLRFIYLTPERTVSSKPFGFEKSDYSLTIDEVKKTQSDIKSFFEKYGTDMWPCKGNDGCSGILKAAEDRMVDWLDYKSAQISDQVENPKTDIPF